MTKTEQLSVAQTFQRDSSALSRQFSSQKSRWRSVRRSSTPTWSPAAQYTWPGRPSRWPPCPQRRRWWRRCSPRTAPKTLWRERQGVGERCQMGQGALTLLPKSGRPSWTVLRLLSQRKRNLSQRKRNLLPRRKNQWRKKLLSIKSNQCWYNEIKFKNKILFSVFTTLCITLSFGWNLAIFTRPLLRTGISNLTSWGDFRQQQGKGYQSRVQKHHV